ncbi:MAG: SLBB domain-containing protein [Bacteroidales bacterium]|nr:SLBB domain-containing protein [Bacteroidales bacterium]
MESFILSVDVTGNYYITDEVFEDFLKEQKIAAGIKKNRVNIEGSVWRPGAYAINPTTSNLKQLITAAGGIRENAYTQRGIVYRLGENKEKIQLSFNVTDVIIGKESIDLFPDDTVTIFSARALEPERTVRISGEVNSPANGGVYEYREGITIGDLILMAGGVTDAATLAKVEVARRVRRADGDVVELSDTVAKVMHFNLLKNPAGAEFKLEPFDIVFVRRSASFKEQQSVSISGEVNYPGTYVVESNVVRLSDIVNRAGGFNKSAYVKGAKLTRTLTEEEYDRLVVAMEIAKTRVADSVELDMMEIGESYTIAIDLEKAIAEPGGIADVVLRTGDVISVPKFNSTVKISGAVMYPNTVSYNPKYNFSNYLANAGGVTQNGIKRKTYMVHMNGSVATKGDPNFKVQPGTEIVVPTREEPKGGGQTLAAILGIATTTASLAAMVTSIVNNVK